MHQQEHLKRIADGDISPRVVQHACGANSLFVAWTPTWEGPARPDHPAADADLRDRLAVISLPQKQREALLYPDGKHDFRTLKALAEKGLATVTQKAVRGRRHALTPADRAWVAAYREQR